MSILISFRAFLRISEVLQLRVKDIILAEGVYTFKVQKAKRKPSGFEAHIPENSFIGEMIFLLLQKVYWKDKPCHCLCPASMEVPSGKEATSGVLQRRFKQVVVDMGWDPKRYTFHSCKRGGATNAISKGLAAPQVAKMARWKNPAMAGLYNRPALQELKRLSEKALN